MDNRRRTSGTLDKRQTPMPLENFFHKERVPYKTEVERILQRAQARQAQKGVISRGDETDNEIEQMQDEIMALEIETNRQVQHIQVAIDSLVQLLAQTSAEDNVIPKESPAPRPPTRKRKTPRKLQHDKNAAGTKSMFPDLHPYIDAELPLERLIFNPQDDKRGMRSYKDINVFGTLKCTNPCCKKTWISGYVATMVRLYRDGRYNARVYHQHCRECETLVRPELDVAVYQKRVSFWLKKWLGYKVYRELPQGNRFTPPHDWERCEGCKDGHCVYSRSVDEERTQRKLESQKKRETKRPQPGMAALEAETNQQIQETQDRIDRLTAILAQSYIVDNTRRGLIATAYAPTVGSSRASQAEPNNQLIEETYCTFPELHYLIQEELPLEDLAFNPSDNKVGIVMDDIISNFGSLNCPRCQKEWVSGYITTTARLYINNSYNTPT